MTSWPERRPRSFAPGYSSPCPAVVASSVFVLLIKADADPGLAQIAAMVISLVMRAYAQWFGWYTGSAADLSDKVWSFWSRKSNAKLKN